MHKWAQNLLIFFLGGGGDACTDMNLPQRKGRMLGTKYLILMSSKNKILFTSLHYVNCSLWHNMTCSGHHNINVTLTEGQFLFVVYTLVSSCCLLNTCSRCNLASLFMKVKKLFQMTVSTVSDDSQHSFRWQSAQFPESSFTFSSPSFHEGWNEVLKKLKEEVYKRMRRLHSIMILINLSSGVVKSTVILILAYHTTDCR
jgi:hypothetical protein